MKELNLEQMEIIDGGSFASGFCITVGLFSAGAGIAVLLGATVATGGAAAWLLAGAVAWCAIYAIAS